MKLSYVAAIIILMCVLLQPSDAHAQWTQLDGLYGEPVRCVRASSTKLFAMTNDGVYDSDDNGITWNKVPALYLTNIIERLSASGDTIVAFAIPDSYISTDDGATWSVLNPPAGGMTFASEIVVENGKIYHPTFGDYLYTSADGGTSWNQITSGLTTSEINCAWADGNNVAVGTDDGVFISTDGGVNFSFSGLPGDYVTRVFIESPYVFAYSFAGISKSDDNGQTWGPFEPVSSYPEVTDFTLNGTTVYAATTADLLSSNVMTPNWASVNFSQNIQYNYSIFKNGTDLILGSNRGVYLSDNNGSTWNEINDGIIPVNTGSVTVLGSDTVFAGSSIHGVSIYDGTNWEFSSQALLNCFDLITVGNDVYSSSEFGIYKTSDGGTTWDYINVPPVNPVPAFVANIAVSDSLILGASLQNGILRSGDFGSSWSLQSTGLAGSLVSCVTVSGNNIIVGTYNNGMFVSTDGGFTFTQTGIVGELIYDVITMGSKVIAATNDPVNGNFLSLDDGLSWIPVGSDFFDNLAVSGNYLIAAAPGYIQLSLDSGATYQYTTPAPAGTNIASVTASANEIFIGTFGDGVWKTSFSIITGTPEVTRPEINAQIYPNLFSDESFLYVDETTLSNNPQLRITDINGKLLSNEKIFDRKTKISATGLAPGIYFYTVTTELLNSKTGKLIVY